MDYYLKQLVDISVALGNGVYSVGEDIVYGIERTAEGLGTQGRTRIEEIGFENEQIVELIIEAFKYPTEEKGPLYRAIKIILIEYLEKFPEEALRRIAKKAGMGAAFIGGRMIIGRRIAATVAKRILLKIAASNGFKMISKRLGISALATASGVGTVVGLLMAQGVAQRASDGRKELERSHPKLSRWLKREGNLDLLYFLLKDPLKKQMEGIKKAMQQPIHFKETTIQVHVGA